MSSKLHNAFNLIRNGHFMIFLNEIRKRIYSRSVSIGLQRDMNDEFEAPSAKIEFQIRPLKNEDVDFLLDTSSDTTINPRIIASQKSMVNANIQTCYVAVTSSDKPCFMQWLIGYDDKEELEKHSRGIFPPIKKHEALLEGAYCNPDYRGLGIMQAAISLIVAENAPEIDARKIITFIDITNIPSLKGLQRSGFEPYLMRKCQSFLFYNTISFYPVSDELCDFFYKVTESDRIKTGINQ